MFKFLLLTLISLSTFASEKSECHLTFFQPTWGHTRTAIDDSRITGLEAQFHFERIPNAIPHTDELDIIRYTVRRENLWKEVREINQDQCGKTFKEVVRLEELCTQGQNISTTCELFCYYESTRDPDCNY